MNKNTQARLLGAIVLAGLVPAGAALAADASTTFNVTATVNETCIVSATDLTFGVYDPNAASLDGASTITATCTDGADYSIALDDGDGTPTVFGTRAMTANGVSLDYELYSDSSRTVVWNAAAPVAKAGANPGANVHTVYGQIPTGQFVAPGNYSDIIDVTLTY
ncbi:MAG: spore coat U domain-containing protein [Thiohalomonadaceae bacterium]